MKKSLFAVAAVTAFAGAAQAQSSVTVYGIIDAGFSGISQRGATNAKSTTNGFTGNGAETTSRLGFKGNEDLGGGATAFFTYEVAMDLQSTTLIGSNRQAFVGYGQKGVGKAAIGTQYTVVHNAVSATDPGQSNNVIGSVIRPNGGLDATQNAGNSSVARSYTVRTTNQLSLNSDKFAGFGLNAMYVQNGKDETQVTTRTATTGGNTNFSGWGLSADYAWKKLYAVAAYQSLKQEQANTGAAFGSSFPGTSTVTNNINTTDNSWYLAATYDFGILKGYINYVNQKMSSNYNTANYYSRSGQQIGVRSYITPVIEGWASIGNGKLNLESATPTGTSRPSSNFNAWQLGSNYYLSKRTNLYAIYGQTVGAGNISSSGTAGSGYALGLRHTF
jgi:predicted porin